MKVIIDGLKVVGERNRREHWAAVHRRAKNQKEAVWAVLSSREARYALPPLPLVVYLTRVGPKALDDDNLVGGFKAVRDQIASWLRVDDGDPRVRYVCRQRAIGRRAYAVEIEFVTEAQEATSRLSTG